MLARRTLKATALLGIWCVVCGSSYGQTTRRALTSRPARPTTRPAVVDPNAPRLSIEPAVWDFGEAWYGEVPKGELTLKNVGKSTLQITRVRTSCGCTAAALGKKELEPGESVPLKITYKKKRAGKVSQTVTVLSNDPVQPSTIVRVKGEVKALFEGTKSISFGQLDSDSNETKTIELTNAWKEPISLKLKDTKPNTEYYDVRLEEVEPGQRYTLTVATKPPLKVGALITNVNLATSLERIPVLSVPVRASVVARVSVRPAILWVNPRSSARSERPIRVTYRSDHPIEITEIKTGHEKLKARLEPPRAQTRETRFKTQLIMVTLPPADEIPDEGTKLEILTNDAEYPRFEVVVRRVQARRTPGRGFGLRPGRPGTAGATTRPALRPGRPAGGKGGKGGQSAEKPGKRDQP